MKVQDILVYLAVLFDGEWDQIYDAIKNKIHIRDEDVKDTLEKIKCKYVTMMDPEYPKILTNIYKPPFVLFYYGDLSLTYDYSMNLAVVGSRNASRYAIEKTDEIVTSLAGKFNIVSGLARGIDSAAHRAAIKSGGKTIAILGCGIDFCYPNINKDIYEIIKNNHLLLSEHPGNKAPTQDSFPFRNRIIAGLSKGLFVPECKIRSGTLVTVYHALNMNRDIMCLPHQAGEDSECNRLIREGAALVEKASDIIEQMK